jgi:membrane fusion protein, multidrug efflux system
MRAPSDRYRVALIGLCACVLAALASPLRAATATEGTVILTPASVTASGVATARLSASRRPSQLQVIATVLDTQPLLTLAAQLQSTHANATAATAVARAAIAEATRSHTLYQQDENISLREVQAADAAAAQAQAQQIAAVAQAAAARSSARVQWGKPLAALAERGPHALDEFADGRAALLAVVLPSGSATPVTDTIRLSTPSAFVLARLIGPSPHADAVVQGPTFFYRTEGTSLRVGQRLTAAVSLSTAPIAGIAVPDAAVLWYAGQPWAYIEISAGHYVRRPLAQDARDATGWFQTSGFHAGECVVVRGGELLLSQELKPPPGAAPAGDGDDD